MQCPIVSSLVAHAAPRCSSSFVLDSRSGSVSISISMAGVLCSRRRWPRRSMSMSKLCVSPAQSPHAARALDCVRLPRREAGHFARGLQQREPTDGCRYTRRRHARAEISLGGDRVVVAALGDGMYVSRSGPRVRPLRLRPCPALPCLSSSYRCSFSFSFFFALRVQLLSSLFLLLPPPPPPPPPLLAPDSLPPCAHSFTRA